MRQALNFAEELHRRANRTQAERWAELRSQLPAALGVWALIALFGAALVYLRQGVLGNTLDVILLVALTPIALVFSLAVVVSVVNLLHAGRRT